MEAHHASLGRRTLEEIRQKRAAERLNKASSGSDHEGPNPYGVYRPESRSRTSERDSSGLLYRFKELEKKNTDLEYENKKLLSKLEERTIEKDSLLKRLKDLEEDTLPSLRKAMKGISIEKDAAVVAREDLLSQLRTIKKRLKEAEEEQYRAEEDAAALRAELNSLQQQDMRNPYADISSNSDSAERIQALEKEIMDLKSELQRELILRQQEQQKLSEEQLRASSLVAEKQELERRLTAFTKQSLEEALEDAAHKAIFTRDKEKAEKQLHDMAVMVEKLESSRHKLLMEIDSQSSEIERLFEENSNLSASYKDAMGTAAEWENQVKECLKQNQELRAQLDKLRSNQVYASHLKGSQLDIATEKYGGNVSDLTAFTEENPWLKDQLAKEQSKSEALSSEVLQLSAELKHAVQAYNNLTRLYRPVLRNIENNLMKMKQDKFVAI